MANEEKRLFTAIRCSSEVADVLKRNAAHLETAGKIRVTRPENFHLTLIYVGGTSRENDVRQAMRTVAQAPFTLEFAPAGKFLRREGLLIWQGVRINEDLLSLHKQVNENLCWRGFCGPNLAYKPHITLGRRFRPQQGIETESVLAELEIPPVMHVSDISLFESKREKDVLVYEELERFELQSYQ